MSKINYVLARDEDFELNTMGTYTYLGKELYVEIPHKIKGRPITNYKYMFMSNKTISAVKATSKKIKDVTAMFYSCHLDELDLSECNFSNVDTADFMFSGAIINKIIFPATGKFKPIQFYRAFDRLQTCILDISCIDFSRLEPSKGVFSSIFASKIIFPTENIKNLLMKSEGEESVLENIPRNSQTEDICWAAILNNKQEGRFAKIKSKKILMYLGSECPEYIELYYSKEN